MMTDTQKGAAAKPVLTLNREQIERNAIADGLVAAAEDYRAGKTRFVVAVYLHEDGQVGMVRHGDFGHGEEILKVLGMLDWHKHSLNGFLDMLSANGGLEAVKVPEKVGNG